MLETEAKHLESHNMTKVDNDDDDDDEVHEEVALSEAHEDRGVHAFVAAHGLRVS
jgi:hypothetical protein